MAVDSQVELDPAGLQSELHWGVQGSEVQLLFIYLVSSEREGRDFLSQEQRDLPERLVQTLRSFFQGEYEISHMYQA